MSAPTLLVGLGGVGSDIVKRVYKRATEKQRKNISFVVFDTDVNELKNIAGSNLNIHTIQVSASITVGEYLKFDENARDKWFPVNRVLNSKVMTDGAGQVRAISRLAFNTALMQGKLSPLDDAIQELYKLRGDALTQAPRVIVTGSLCGGTGSGLTLPVCMYIRNYLQTKVQQGTSIIRGFFLLPEVFDGVIKGVSERNNLKCNAYAAVREIDAFMMKADGTLPESYDLHFTIPRTNSKIEDEYTGRPMDYCFLFDGQNMDGLQLNSFSEYKEHAANCIYGMAIAPTSDRGNSSEDNVIRDIVREQGRDRYAGSGTSLLVYPQQDIKRYLALHWTKDSVSDEWLEIDKRFMDEQAMNRSRRKEGFSEQSIDRGQHYVKVIDEGVAQHQPFPKAIHDLCVQFEDGKKLIESGNLWDAYLDELDKYVKESITREKATFETLVQGINAHAKSASGDDAKGLMDTFTKWYDSLLGYKNATIQCSKELARNTIYSLFRDSKDYTKTSEKYRLEYWLQTDHNPDKFMHPNAIRYMLYNTRENMREYLSDYTMAVEKIDKFWDGFEEATFDDPNTDDHKESKEEFMQSANFDAKGLQRLKHKEDIKDKKEHLINQFSNMLTNINDYWTKSVMRDVYAAAVTYLEQLCSMFESFYDALGSNRVVVDEEIAQLERAYEIRDGIALRYVCADKDCLRGLASEVTNQNDPLDLPGSLSSTIYSELRRFAMNKARIEVQSKGDETKEQLKSRQMSSDLFCVNLFNQTIVAHLTEMLEDQYSRVINMDVLSALEKEAVFKNPGCELTEKEKELHVSAVLESTEKLAKPFIENPRDKQPRIITACTYSPSLTNPPIPIKGRKEFVLKKLKDNGGVESSDIEPNMIMYYQAVYDLKACDLGKFAPPEKTETTDRQAGDYYKAYQELISEIHPEPQKSRAITPHLNRWWHVITMIPDLSDDSQRVQEEKIARAFFWGILGKYIRFRKDNTGRQYYYPAKKRLGMGNEEDEELIVSNATPCDKLYEVLDAFTIYPRLCSLVLDKTEFAIQCNLTDKKKLRESVLYRLMDDLVIDEYPLVKTEQNGIVCNSAVRSLLEIPILMKRSVPTELFVQRNIDRLMDVIFTDIYHYLERFSAKQDLPSVYSGLLISQYRLMIENLWIEAETNPELKLMEDPMLDDILERIEDEIVDKGIPDDADEVAEMRKQRTRYGNLNVTIDE